MLAFLLSLLLCVRSAQIVVESGGSINVGGGGGSDECYTKAEVDALLADSQAGAGFAARLAALEAQVQALLPSPPPPLPPTEQTSLNLPLRRN